jgi:hypothetical protein
MQITAQHAHNMQALFCWSTIFTKTHKGREEIAQRRAGLNARQRSVLIMLDGIKRLDKLMSPIPKSELGTIVNFLAQEKLIEVSKISVTNSMSNEVTAPINRVLEEISVTPIIINKRKAFLMDDKKLREVKNFMTTTAHTYLGLLSAELIMRIERAKDAPQLMAIVGQWHMALRDSKHGHRFASDYLEKTLATLRGEDVGELSE